MTEPIGRRLEAAYWSEATNDHIKYVGTAAGAIDYTLETCNNRRTHHMLSNVLIDLASPLEARSESYVHAYTKWKVLWVRRK